MRNKNRRQYKLRFNYLLFLFLFLIIIVNMTYSIPAKAGDNQQLIQSTQTQLFDFFPKTVNGQNGINLQYRSVDGSYTNLTNNGDFSFVTIGTSYNIPSIMLHSPNDIFIHPSTGSSTGSGDDLDPVICVTLNGDFGKVHVSGQVYTDGSTISDGIRYYIYKGANNYDSPIWETSNNNGSIDLTVPYVNGEKLYFAADAGPTDYRDWGYFKNISFQGQEVSSVSVSLNKSNATVTKGNTEQLVATVLPSNATNKNVSWVSSDPSVATVNSTGLVTALNPGITAITVSTVDGNKTATCIVTVTEATTSVASVSLNKSNATVTKGNTEQLVATVLPTNATNKNVAWVSSDPSIATVNFTGLVIALNPGITSVTVSTADGNKMATCMITVTEAQVSVVSISLNKTNATITKGNTEQLVATVLPSNVTNKNVSWESSDPSVASVNSTGLVTALNPGITVITVSTVDGNKTATCIITVTEAQISVVSVSLNESNATVTKGNTEQMVATVLPSNATNKNVSWVSSDPSVATVNSTGLVTALNPGITAVTVSTVDGNKMATCMITVTEATSSVVSVSLNKSNASVIKGNTEQLVVTISPSNATNKNVSWVSSDPTVATVNATGLVTALNPGITAVTVSTVDGNKTATCIITVTEPTELQLDYPESVSVTFGKTQAIKIYKVQSDDTKVDVTQEVTLVSDDPATATVTRGVIKGISVGDTVVRGTYQGLDIEISVTVTPPVTKLSADPSVINLMVDRSETITLTATYKDGNEADVTGSAAIWKSSKPQFATVDVDGNVTGVAIGTTTITGNFGGKTATITVNVIPELDHIVVQPGMVGVAKGKTQSVTIYAIYVDGSKVNITKAVRLTSDDLTVATVTGAIVKGITPDCDTVVRGTYLGQDIEISVKVTQPLKKLEADTDASGLNLAIEGSETITLTATYTDGSSEEVNDYVTATSSKPSVATVDVEGGSITVTGVATGSATITLSYEGKKVTVKVKVTA